MFLARRHDFRNYFIVIEISKLLRSNNFPPNAFSPSASPIYGEKNSFSAARADLQRAAKYTKITTNASNLPHRLVRTSVLAQKGVRARRGHVTRERGAQNICDLCD